MKTIMTTIDQHIKVIPTSQFGKLLVQEQETDWKVLNEDGSEAMFFPAGLYIRWKPENGDVKLVEVPGKFFKDFKDIYELRNFIINNNIIHE